MGRILFAWELGANFGHLARDLPVAKRLRELGHDVLFAVKDVRVAMQALEPAGFHFVQAPCPNPPLRLATPPVNYSEILVGTGYCDPSLLGGLVQAWLRVFEFYGADIVVINHAPTALLAARVGGLAAIATCIGFELPPDTDVLPSIRPWESIPEPRLRQADAQALQQINAVLRQHGKAPLPRVADLFANVPAVLTTFPELDHYGARVGSRYTGPISALPNVAEREWPRGGNARIFAYLRPLCPWVHTFAGSVERNRRIRTLCGTRYCAGRGDPVCFTSIRHRHGASRTWHRAQASRSGYRLWHGNHVGRVIGRCTAADGAASG